MSTSFVSVGALAARLLQQFSELAAGAGEVGDGEDKRGNGNDAGHASNREPAEAEGGEGEEGEGDGAHGLGAHLLAVDREAGLVLAGCEAEITVSENGHATAGPDIIVCHKSLRHARGEDHLIRQGVDDDAGSAHAATRALSGWYVGARLDALSVHEFAVDANRHVEAFHEGEQMAGFREKLFDRGAWPKPFVREAQTFDAGLLGRHSAIMPQYLRSAQA